MFVGWKDALNRLFTCDLEATRLTRLTRLTSLACLSFMLALCRAGETKFEDYSRREVQREKEERAEKTKERERNAKSNGTPVNTYSTTTDHRTGQQDNRTTASWIAAAIHTTCNTFISLPKMLRRPPTRIPLKTDDIEEYEEVSEKL